MSRYDILQGRVPQAPVVASIVPSSQIVLGSEGVDGRFYAKPIGKTTIIERFRGRENHEYRCCLIQKLLATKVHWYESEKRFIRCNHGDSCPDSRWRVVTTLVVYESMDRRPRQKPRVVPWVFGERMFNNIRNLYPMGSFDEFDFKMECVCQDFQTFENLRLCRACFCDPWKEELRKESAVLLKAVQYIFHRKNNDMTYKNSKEWLEAMKSHRCAHKEFLAADDPSNDFWTAKIEKREPLKYPTLGYICNSCEETFRLECHRASLDVMPKEQRKIIEPLLRSGAGRQKLAEYLSSFTGE